MANKKLICMNAQEAIAKAEQELSTSFYIADISRSPGMKVIHSNRCRWLSVIVGLAKKIASGKAVEVVRCKNCKCAYINSFSAASGVAVCRHWSNEAKTVIVQQDDFCSYGERRYDGNT